MRLIKHIKASNLLSFGPDGLDLELHDLNVLIGPNGSGKSNFLEIFEVLRALPRNEEARNNLIEIMSKGGASEEWIWKGYRTPEIFLEISLNEFKYNNQDAFNVKHDLHIVVAHGPYILKEFVKKNSFQEDMDKSHFFYKNDRINDVLIWDSFLDDLKQIPSPGTLSILCQRIIDSPLSDIADAYEKIRLYREWTFGRNTIFRTPQRADQRNDRLEPDFSNLGMFLSRLRKDPATKRALVTGLQDLYEGLTDFEVITEGGTVQIFFTEGDFSIPAARLSDGTLRYLCLLAILLDPTPPPLICIEEPELGLHPDIMPKIADLLIDASKRTQLVVTTHSDVLIDALSEQPESILVCEKHEGQTQIKRLNKKDIAHWLKDYSLGQLWTRGEIGGTRW